MHQRANTNGECMKKNGPKDIESVHSLLAKAILAMLLNEAIKTSKEKQNDCRTRAE